MEITEDQIKELAATWRRRAQKIYEGMHENLYPHDSKERRRGRIDGLLGAAEELDALRRRS